MDLDRLRSFIQIIETGSFSLAAASLNVTQSTISSRIQGLEAELGQTLFSRGRGGADLTPAGIELQTHARRIIQIWEQARQGVALPQGYHAVFRLGAPVSLWDGVIARWVDWMRHNAPGVALYLGGSYSDGLFEQVSNGLLDVALLYSPRYRDHVIVEPLMTEELMLVRHPHMAGEWFDNYALVDLGEEFAVSHTQAFADMPPPSVTVSVGALALRYVLDLKGSCYLPARAANPLVAKGDLVVVAEAPRFTRQIYAVYPAQPRNPHVTDLARAGLRALMDEPSV
ncbi:LysR family transcriptional regulator [Acidisphaera sp. L21]|uniref:LysR family transcriptional regulator n=1 Tax=Acidisphaera sp. L21 TaxID=1641851 RepID=UPI00131EC8FA|nr:LysR family transcriptional regulator [Acidisphaera sp. L21]